MIALTQFEASEWPRYSLNAGALLERVDAFKVEVRIPDLKYELRVFAADIMTILDERYNETQKMIHLTEWTLGTEEFDQVGWKACELMRRGYNELRPLEAAPALVFRFDESVEARAFLLQVFLNQWSANLVPLTAPFCISIDEEHLWLELENAETVDYVIGKLRRWSPRQVSREVQ